MRLTLSAVESAAAAVRNVNARTATSCAWLQACDYPGIDLLLQADQDLTKSVTLETDVLGLDLHNVSCVFLGENIMGLVRETGRLFLRNVRHGLYLVPLTVEANLAIGCPVDPAFAVGGERHKNPYVEKLAIAERDGVEVDEDLWRKLIEAGKHS